MNDTITSQGACAGCSGDSPTGAVAIGRRVSDVATLGRGEERTDYTFLQCSACGSVWVELRDTGANGRERFFQRITKHLF